MISLAWAIVTGHLTRVRDERGATAVEYGLLIALIAVVIMSTVLLAGGKIATMYNSATVGW